MGRWKTFLALGAVLLIAVVDADDCPLNGQEEHAWLIRITPMKGKDDGSGSPTPEGNGETKMMEFLEENDDSSFEAAGMKQNPHYRYKRQDTKPAEGTPTPAGGDTKPSEAASGGPAGGETTSSGEAEMPGEPPEIQGGQGGEPQPGESVMHGALISAAIVLTTTYNEYEWMFISPMQPGFLSLVGYNAGKSCMQEQWAREAQYHTHASEFALNAGEFAIIHTQEPFKVEAEPFLFGPSGLPPVPDILNSYNTLVEQSPEGKVMMYLFKDPKTVSHESASGKFKYNRFPTRGTVLGSWNSKLWREALLPQTKSADLKTDGSTYDISQTTFKFIPWRVCQEMDSLMTAGGKGMSPRTTAGTFFCSTGIPGILNETLGGITSGYGYDWYQGSPVIFTREDKSIVPIGHYIYRVGKTGDPRIYATYTTVLSTWLQSPSIIGAQTLPPQDLDYSSEVQGDLETHANGEDKDDEGSGKSGKATKRSHVQTNSGHHISMAKLWVSICASASTIRFIYKPRLRLMQ